MELISMSKLKESPLIIQDIRWDLTPKIFMDPSSVPGDASGKGADITYGYMLYVDLMDEKPVLVLMQLKRIMSKSVGYVPDVPEELLREAMQCEDSDCIAGMYPLNASLESWLKNQLGIS